jgi:hypothetical protein
MIIKTSLYLMVMLRAVAANNPLKVLVLANLLPVSDFIFCGPAIIRL